MFERLDNIAYSSVLEALSPSTPPYNCSKHTLAVSDSGNSCANISPKYPVRINTPFECVEPESSTSRSMFTIPSFPAKVFAVIFAGFPNV